MTLTGGLRAAYEAQRAYVHAFREFAVDHHGLFDSLLPAPKPGEDDEIYTALAEPAMIVADIVTSLGVASDQVIPTGRALGATVHGFIVREHSGGFGMPHDIDASFENTLDLILTPRPTHHDDGYRPRRSDPYATAHSRAGTSRNARYSPRTRGLG